MMLKIDSTENASLRAQLPMPMLTVTDANQVLIVSALSAPADGSAHRTHVTVYLSQGPELGFWLDLVHPAACPFRGVRRALLDHLEQLERGGDAHAMQRVRRLRDHMDELLCA